MRDIINNKFDFNFDKFENNFLVFVYKNSKINIEDYYETSALISTKTSNNQKIIDNMEFYVFNNFMYFYNKTLEKEGKENTNGDAKDYMSEAKRMSKSSLSSSKSQLSKIK